MTVGAVILARLDSRRLPRKALRKVGNQPMIEHIIGRVQQATTVDGVVVATTDRPLDDALADFCVRLGVPVFRGDTDDVAKRFLGAMQANAMSYGVRVNGDNLFASPSMIDQLIQIATRERADFVSNVPGRTFPYGMSVEIVRRAWFETMYPQFTQASHREHVTSFLYETLTEGPSIRFVRNTDCPEAAGCKLAVDTEEDLARSERIMRMLGPGDLDDMAAIVRAARTFDTEEAP